jgi:sugar phosphate isomerase/epimerase
MPTNEERLLSRRKFTSLLLAGVPLSYLSSKIHGVQLGAITYSYRAIPDAEAIVHAMGQMGLSEVELMSNHAEALLGAPKGANAEALRAWRRTFPISRWGDVKTKFNRVGIDVRLLTYNMNVRSTTDEDVEYAFQMAKALGARAITTSTQVSMAKRIAPFAEKHAMVVGFHGHDQTDRADEVSSEASFQAVMAASKYLWCNLDIGHYTAANGDAVAFIRKYHDRITNLHVKDRKKDHGPNMSFGQGDTPIKEVLQLMKSSPKTYNFPANIEFEYSGDPLVEMPKCIAYCKNALA